MAGASIKPISEWDEQQLWAAFMLVDGLHDYGDVSKGRSVVGAYEWYIAQDIPTVLRNTYRVPPDNVDISVKEYADTLFGINLSPSTKVEPLLTNLLQRGLPERMGLTTAPVSFDDFALVPSGIYYKLPLTHLVAIAVAGGDALNRLIEVCKSLRRIRVDKEGFKESGTEITAEAQAGLNQFFGSLVVAAAEPALISNFDASPGFYKYLYGFTQTFTPLNFLDSVGASDALVAPGSASQYVKATNFSYNTQFMSLKRRGEEGEGPLFSITISTVDAKYYPLTIRVLRNGVEIASDRITGTFDGGKQYTSGPTLGYIANLIAAIQNEPKLDESILRTLIAEAHDGKNIYKLEPLILSVARAVGHDQTLICRFLSDWKGYGDAEQVRVMAEVLARAQNVEQPVLNVAAARSVPTNSFMGGTVDENSHQQMTLRNITHGYSHFKFYDFVVFPSTPPTFGDRLYSRITDLLARATGVINLAHKLSALSPLSADLIEGIRAGYTGVTEVNVRSQLAIPDRAAQFGSFLTTLLKYKLCNAHQFVSECRRTDAEALNARVGEFQIPRTAFEWLKGKNQEDIGTDNTVTVLLDGTPTPIPVAGFADTFEATMNAQQPNANLCASVLANLAPPRLATDAPVPDMVPVPYIQTVVFGTVPGTEYIILKQNTTIGFEPKHLTVIATNLADILSKCTYPDVVIKSTQKITGALYAFLSSFYVPDGAEFNKDVIDRIVYEFKQPILEECEKVRVASAAAKRQEREAVTNSGRDAIAALMAARATALVAELLGRLQLDTCEARMTAQGGQRGGADPIFTTSIGGLFTVAGAFAIPITGVGWAWEDEKVITFATGLDDASVLYNDDGLATNEEEPNEEVDMLPPPAPRTMTWSEMTAEKQRDVVGQLILDNPKLAKAVKSDPSLTTEDVLVLSKPSVLGALPTNRSITRRRPGAPRPKGAVTAPPPRASVFGGLRERRPLYSNARSTDDAVQLVHDEGLRERRRTRRSPRVRQPARKSGSGGQRDDMDSV